MASVSVVKRVGKRKTTYYARYKINGKDHYKNLKVPTEQMANIEASKIEESLILKSDLPFPTETPLKDALSKYAQHLLTVKTPKNAQKDISVLRTIFGPICEELQVKNSKIQAKAGKKKALHKIEPIAEKYFEKITTGQISEFIANAVRRKGITGKTANGYRQILTRLFNWSTKQRGVRMPGGKNPAAEVERYKEAELEIVFLNLDQIDEQLDKLSCHLQFQTMVAVYIYAGLRREEALWLRVEDIDLHAGEFGVIHIRNKTVGGRYWEPKTGKSRVVPISSTLRWYLDRYTPNPSNDNWFFSSPTGTWYDTDNFSRDLLKVQKQIGLNWGPDEYRHTFGSQLAAKGESLFKISQLMGNSETICAKHYVRVMPEALVNSVEFPKRKDFEPVVKAVVPPSPIDNPANTGFLRLVVNNVRQDVAAPIS